MNIADYIPYGHENAINRRLLEQITGFDDRYNRQLIMKARNEGAVILNMEDGKGYFQPILPQEIDLVRKSYNKEAGRYYASATMMKLLEQVFELHQQKGVSL